MESDNNGLARPVRCAIYTRKSSEEGLDQQFNSLDAQREAAEAYIESQRQEGWLALPTSYADGGFTGANRERPALRKLLEEIEAGGVDCVVVYKVDRLSRSLLDFARIIDEFDQRGVSFVSVTQQFNTRVPVGRLTLNILLSFAEFERDIIRERTRDKKAAAKRKGMWTGGYVPLGYDLDPRGGRLLVNEVEAAQVRRIFELFLKQRSIAATLAEVRQRGWTTKSWVTEKNKRHTGAGFTERSLMGLLSNELYAGVVSYGGQNFRGAHQRIVDRRLWKRVAARIQTVPRTPVRQERNQNGALLKGLLYCASCEQPMSHTYTAKGERRYGYYLCRARRSEGCSGQSLAAQAFEDSVLEQLAKLRQPTGPPELLKRLKALEAKSQSRSPLDLLDSLRAVVERISYDAATGGVVIRLRGAAEKRDV